MTLNELWEKNKIYPGISDGEFTEDDFRKHNERVSWWHSRLYPVTEVKEDESLWTKKRIREELKKLTDECYEILNRNKESEFAAICNQPRLEELNRRIKAYKYRLRPVNTAKDDIRPDDIRLAKDRPIQNFYTGRLRSAGKNLTGLCPFHQEKSPSFTLYQNNTRFHCFGCQATGDTIDFVMKINNLKLPEAVKLILGF